MLSKTEKAIRYLSEDSLSHIDMLEPLRRGTADVVYAENDGVIIYERNSQACMITMQELEKCKSLPGIESYHLFAVHQKNIAAWIQQKGGFSHCFEAYQAAYGKKEPFADHFDTIRPLTRSCTDQVFRGYGAMDDRKYIETLLDRKRLWGIFDGDALAGFIGEHLEGSMGLLEVFPEYRRKGYGYRLESYLINHFLQQNEVPFCQIKTDNDVSLALQRKLGMNLSKRTTTWLFS